MWCVAGNHNYISHICAKGFLNLSLNYTVIDKISNFQEIAPNFIYCKESTFSFLPVVSRYDLSSQTGNNSQGKSSS